MADPAIEMAGVWKIFGDAERAALADASRIAIMKDGALSDRHTREDRDAAGR